MVMAVSVCFVFHIYIFILDDFIYFIYFIYYLGGVFLLSANSANLIKSVFVAKGYTIKTFFKVITQSDLFSFAKDKIDSL